MQTRTHQIIVIAADAAIADDSFRRGSNALAIGAAAGVAVDGEGRPRR